MVKMLRSEILDSYRLGNHTKETIKRFDGNGHNDRSDAFRHCYWSCCMARGIGVEEAKKFGDSHENYGNNPRCEKLMDLFNLENLVAIYCGPLKH